MADKNIRMFVRNTLDLPRSSVDAYIYATTRDGGLGVVSLRAGIPRILHCRLTGILESSNDRLPLRFLQGEMSGINFEAANLGEWNGAECREFQKILRKET